MAIRELGAPVDLLAGVPKTGQINPGHYMDQLRARFQPIQERGQVADELTQYQVQKADYERQQQDQQAAIDRRNRASDTLSNYKPPGMSITGLDTSQFQNYSGGHNNGGGLNQVASVGRWKGNQISIAGEIIRAGRDLGLDARTITNGIMVGMGESSLTNVMHGDRAGPDSRGVFQQRDNGAWGSLQDRSDPYTAAQNYFRALTKVKGYQNMSPTMAAHLTQRNADPNYYSKFWGDASKIYGALTNGTGGGKQQQGYTNPTPGYIPTGTWGKYASGGTHNALDIAVPLNTKVMSPAAGKVIVAGWDSGGFGNSVRIQDLNGNFWILGHLNSLNVKAGQQVGLGQNVGRSGNTGKSTGPHLHVEARKSIYKPSTAFNFSNLLGW